MKTVQLAGEIFPSFNSTNGIAVDVYLSGCAREPKCEGCHNQLLWDFNYGRAETIENVVALLKYKYKDADSIAIMGGEPLNQQNLADLLRAIRAELVDKEVWLYTSYKLAEVPRELLELVDFLKTERFDITKAAKGRLGSSNQKLYMIVKEENTEQVFAVLVDD